MTWSDSPPSNKGFYFALYPGCDNPEPLMITDAGQFFVIGNDCPVDMKSIPYRGTRFLQLPTPDELKAMRAQIESLTQQRDAAVKLGPHDTKEAFDWAVLGRIDELETENERLRAQRDAAEAELARCQEKLSEIDTGGMNLEH